MKIESLIGRIIMTADPAERAWYEAQIEINLYARRNLRGNASTVVIQTPAGGALVVTPQGLDDTSPEFLATLHAKGYKILDGRVYFTPKDNPRPYRAPKV